MERLCMKLMIAVIPITITITGIIAAENEPSIIDDKIESTVENADWGQVANGLRCRLYIAQENSLKALEKERIAIDIQNVGSQPIVIPTVNRMVVPLKITVMGYPDVKSPMIYKQPNLVPYVMQPNEVFSFRLSSAYKLADRVRIQNNMIKFEPVDIVYEITACIEVNNESLRNGGMLVPPRDAEGRQILFWSGKIESNSINIRLGKPKKEEADKNHLKLQLRVENDEGRQVFYLGQPISMQIRLLNRRFFGKTRLLSYQQKIETGQIKPETFGTKDWSWFRGITIQANKIEKLNNGQSKATPVLEKQLDSDDLGGHFNNRPLYNSILHVFVIEPEVSQTLEPGTYVLGSSWNSIIPQTQDIGIWQGSLEAEPIEVLVAAPETNEEKGKVAYSRATYHMRKKEFDAALSEALKAEKLFPSYKDSGCYIIAAKACQENRDFRSALEYYKKYLIAHKDTNPNRFPYVTKVKHIVEEMEKQIK